MKTKEKIEELIKVMGNSSGSVTIENVPFAEVKDFAKDQSVTLNEPHPTAPCYWVGWFVGDLFVQVKTKQLIAKTITTYEFQ